MKKILFSMLFILSSIEALASDLPKDCESLTNGLNVEKVCASLDREGAYAVFTIREEGMKTTGNRVGFFLSASPNHCDLESRFTVMRDESVPEYGKKPVHTMILSNDSDPSASETMVMLQTGGNAEFLNISTGKRERMICRD